MVKQDRDLYYTPPSKEVFEDLKNRSIELWKTYDDTYGYATEKISRIKDIQNVEDNFMYMFAMFDGQNQWKILNSVSKETRKELEARMPNPYPY